MRSDKIEARSLSPLERTVFKLRDLYYSYGYSQYSMGKFEEYDFYSRNKDFLVSDAVITFTDTTGKLMALKPDVTLSIVKNDSDSDKNVRKVYYDENVYRVSKRNETFGEIKQTGLECIGDIDGYHLSEVILLAARSLMTVSDDFILVLSDLDILFAVLGEITAAETVKREIIKCVSEKNLHGIDELRDKYSLDPDKLEALKSLLSLYGNAEDVVSRLYSLSDDPIVADRAARLSQILSVFDDTVLADKIEIDFSIVCDLNYYNGIVFKGYVAGVPDSVLSGGQYDRLMEKLNRRSKAIGFAVYLGSLDRLGPPSPDHDVDVLLLYKKDESVSSVRAAVESFVSAGKSVAAVTDADGTIRSAEIYELCAGEVKRIEDRA